MFHPDGVLGTGTIERLAPPDERLPVASTDVVVRISKSIGLPGRVPDIIGLAMRMPAQRNATTPWDVLLVSAATSISRFALRPTASWSTPLSTLMPLSYHGQTWWVRAQLTTCIDGAGLSLDDIRDRIRRGGLEIVVSQARGLRGFTPLARLDVDALAVPEPSQKTAFDPTLNTAPEVTLAPGWLTGIRRQAYARSRQGRDAPTDTLTAIPSEKPVTPRVR